MATTFFERKINFQDCLRSLSEIALSESRLHICRWLLCSIGKCLPDRHVLWFVRNTVLRNCRLAGSLFDHFRFGGGDDVVVSLEEILRKDPGLGKYLSAHISRSLASGVSKGSVAVPQSLHSVRDQRLALGSFQCQWVLQEGSVELALRKKYRWSPKEKRVSQVIHRSAAALEQRGEASSFLVVGNSQISIPAESDGPTADPSTPLSEVFLL